MTNVESTQANPHTIVPVKDYCIATSNHFFCLANEKSLSKTTTKKLYPAKKREVNLRNSALKINIPICLYLLQSSAK